MAERKLWPALTVRAADDAPGESTRPAGVEADLVSATVDDYSPTAILDLTEPPLPPDGLWDPTLPRSSQPAPATLNWRIFFSSAADRDRAAAALRTAHRALEVVPEDVPDEDWAARSQRQLSAIEVGPFVIAPPWDAAPATPVDSTIIIIEPSRGFGTGHHASTRLCLRALAETDVRGARVLDLGTGSGVLALAASLRGARAVTAIDVDSDAIEAARHSAALNPTVKNVDWVVGDFRDRHSPLLGESWDVVLANLTGGMLQSSAERLRQLTASGVLITSGFDQDERTQVEYALQMTTRAAFAEDGWIGLVLSRPAAADSWRGADSTPR